MSREADRGGDRLEPGGLDQFRELSPTVGPPNGQWPVVAGEPARSDCVHEDPGAGPIDAPPNEVVEDDAASRDAAKLAEERDRVGRVEVMEDERGMRDIERRVREGQGSTIRDREDKAPCSIERWPRASRGCQNLQPAVRRGDAERTRRRVARRPTVVAGMSAAPVPTSRTDSMSRPAASCRIARTLSIASRR